jgi:hypothetical protein
LEWLVAQEVGAFNAILSRVSTKIDGSVSITFEANPEEVSVINRLMQLYLLNQRLFTVAVVQVDE